MRAGNRHRHREGQSSHTMTALAGLDVHNAIRSVDGPHELPERRRHRRRVPNDGGEAGSLDRTRGIRLRARPGQLEKSCSPLIRVAPATLNRDQRHTERQPRHRSHAVRPFPGGCPKIGHALNGTRKNGTNCLRPAAGGSGPPGP